MANDVNVIFGAQIDQLISGVEGGKKAIEGFKSGVESMFSSLEKFAALAAGGALFGKLISDANEAAGEVGKLSKVLGISAEEASPLRVQLATLGIGTDVYVESITRLDRQVRTNESTMNRWGVVTRDANGQLLTQTQLLDNALTTWKGFKEGADRNIASQIIFGARTGEVSQLLKLNSESAARAKKDMEELGLEISGKDVDATRAFKVAMNEVKLSIEGIERPIAEALIPALTAMANAFRTNAPTAIEVTRSVMETLVQVATSVWSAIMAINNAVGILFKSMGERDVLEDFKEALGDIATYAARVSTWVQIMASAFQHVFDATSGPFQEDLRRIVGEYDRLEKSIRSVHVAKEDLGKSLGAGDIGSAGGRSASGLLVDKDSVGAAKANIEMQLQALKDGYERLKITEKSAVDTYKETEGQKTQNLLAALADREAKTKELFAKEIAAAGVTATRRADIEKSLSKSLDEIAKERLTLMAEQLRKTTADFEAVGTAVVGAWNAQLRGLLAGTTTWAQAVKSITGDLIIKMIEFVEQWVVKWVAGALARQFADEGAAVASVASQTAAMAATLPIRAGKFTSDIMADAALAFAGIFANLSPLLGPAAAGPAAEGQAVVLAQLANIPKFEFGTDYVPKTGLALVHEGEKITPANQNGGGGSIAFNISALDSASVAAWLRNGGAAQIAKHVAGAMTANPTLRPAY